MAISDYVSLWILGTATLVVIIYITVTVKCNCQVQIRTESPLLIGNHESDDLDGDHDTQHFGGCDDCS